MTLSPAKLREFADELEVLTRGDRMPTLDEVHRFVKSNPKTAVDLVLDLVFAGHLASEETVSPEAAAMSDGRLRELWKESGAAIDRHGRAFIEADLLPRILRLIIEVAARSRPSPATKDETK